MNAALPGQLTVTELIALLKECDPNALVGTRDETGTAYTVVAIDSGPVVWFLRHVEEAEE